MGSTITEKILANASHNKEVVPGDFIVADLNYVMAHDSTGPLAIESFYNIMDKVFDPDKVIIVFDHFFPPPTVAGATLHQKVRKSQPLLPHLYRQVCLRDNSSYNSQ